MAFSHKTDSTKDVRAWLYSLLATLENRTVKVAEKIEFTNGDIRIDIEFKPEDSKNANRP